jgi:catechol 2,3-dioxygenase-like lactoylglutathione lyase family enzyme
MFEDDVHDMKRAVTCYKEILGLEVVFQGGECHTEFALPVKGVRLALSLADKGKKILKGGRFFIPVTDINAIETYLITKGVKTHREKVDDVVLILWVEDSEGNLFAFEQWVNRT